MLYSHSNCYWAASCLFAILQRFDLNEFYQRNETASREDSDIWKCLCRMEMVSEISIFVVIFCRSESFLTKQRQCLCLCLPARWSLFSWCCRSMDGYRHHWDPRPCRSPSPRPRRGCLRQQGLQLFMSSNLFFLAGLFTTC